LLSYRTIIDFTHPDDRAGLAANVAALIAGQIHTGNLEKRNLRADESAVCLKQSASLVRDDASDPLYEFGRAVDIAGERSLRGQLAHAAEHDQLTGLSNRTVIMKHLERVLTRASSQGRAYRQKLIPVAKPLAVVITSGEILAENPL
jgi:predicted signal transduction protein with EAL and GGDEF domain